jgi:hypothetical protein
MAEAGDMETLRALLRHADEDAVAAPPTRDPERHRAELHELGLRVSLTRSRYPNTADGVEMYAVTLSRIDLGRAPDSSEVDTVLASTFGESSKLAIERRGGPMVRMYRVPVASQ